MPRRLLSGLTAASVVLAGALLGAPATAAPPPPDLSGLTVDRGALPSAVEPAVGEALAAAEGTVTAFVELDTPAGVEVAEKGGGPAQVRAAAERTEEVAADVVPAAAPQRIGTVTNLVSGALVVGDAAQLRALADDPDVRSVRLVARRTLDNAAQDEFTRALATWQNTGLVGKDVRVGIIDTGIDYTHADFGGPGTVEAYEAAYGENGTGPIPAGSFDPEKFLGGYDFAGTDYDAGGEGDQLVPVPDENPIDVHGHGTHVAGTTAGYGITPDGTTFTGDHTTLESVADWPVGPGTAPAAQLYALKVFGDVAGSTDLTSLALDWAADPNGDGAFDDRLDVLNLSLGGSGAPADDPESLQVAELTALGTTVVLSAGNEGDVEDIGGSPGNGWAGLTVAWSIGQNLAFDAVEVTEASDASLVGRHAGQNSVAYTGDDVTAPVAYLGEDFDGCTAFTADQAAAVAGKIAFLSWDDDDATRACGSAARFNNATAAGAVGVLLDTELPVFSAGIAGNDVIPGLQLTAGASDALAAEIQAGTLVVRIGPSLALSAREDVAPDTLSPSSSRGVHGSLGWGKPDVAAPGQQIVSANVGTGTGASSSNGTSMASPHVAGIAALVREARPGWSAAQIKAAIVNTATHDVATEAGGDLFYGPARVGSGRVDALAAVTTDTLVYNADRPQQTSVSFGVVELADEPVTIRKAVTVQNLGTTARTYRTAVTSSTTAGGATITAAPASLRVPAGGTGIVTLTFTADPATVAREIDPTQEAEQIEGLPRDFVSQVSGRLVLTAGEQEWRVPVQGTPRPTSDIEGADVVFPDPSADRTELALSGRDLTSDGWFGLVTPLVHAADSPRLEALPSGVETSRSTIAAGDIRHVGWASSAPLLTEAGVDAQEEGYLAVGIATDGDWAALGHSLMPWVLFDTDGDGEPDAVAIVTKASDTDYSVVALLEWTADGPGDELAPLELLTPFAGNIETGAFDNSTVVVPVPLAALGVQDGDQVGVTVQMRSSYAYPADGVVDEVSFSVDPFHPPLWFESNLGGDHFFSLAEDGLTVGVRGGPGATDAKVLLLHHLNRAGDRAQVVGVSATDTIGTSVSLDVDAGAAAGTPTTFTATVTPDDVTGTVAFLEGETEIATAPVEGGTAVATVTALGAGTHEVRAELRPDSPRWTGSTSEPVTVELAASASTTTLTVAPATVTYGQRVTATVKVTGTSWAPSGTVSIRDGSREIATGELAVDGLTGTARVELPRDLRTGSLTLTAVYAGTDDVSGSTGTARLRVLPALPRLTLETASWTVARGSTPSVTVRVGGTDGAPPAEGRVTVLLGLQVVGTPRLTDGVATVTLPPVRTSNVLTVLYTGNARYLPNAVAQVVRVG